MSDEIMAQELGEDQLRQVVGGLASPSATDLLNLFQAPNGTASPTQTDITTIHSNGSISLTRYSYNSTTSDQTNNAQFQTADTQ